MIDVSTRLITGRGEVHSAMKATMGTFKEYETLSDAVFLAMLKAKHSPIEEYRLHFDIIAPERVHTHIARHKECGLYVSTSRPDISYHKPLEEGHRRFAWVINAKRLIEIMQLRLCGRSWKDTVALMKEMRRQVCMLDPVFDKVLHPSCVWCGFCPEEHEGKKNCGYLYTSAYMGSRSALVSTLPSASEMMHTPQEEVDKDATEKICERYWDLFANAFLP